MTSLRWRSLGGVIAVSIAVAGCGAPKKPTHYVEPKVPAEFHFQELSNPVSIRRDYLGIPMVEAKNDDDLYFALGYIAASDRLAQMTSTKLVSQGRLSEWIGEYVIGLDRYMRAINLQQVARNYWNVATPEQKRRLQRYADGVNAYIDSGNLPDGMRMVKYQPDLWRPTDSLAIMALYQLVLSANLQEELAYLKLAQKLGFEKAAWLIPIYPDQPLPFDEARKLWEVHLNADDESIDRLLLAQDIQSSIGLAGMAASNNWAVHKSRTKGGASIIASDPHLPLALPSAWHFVRARTPETDWAGVSLAGMPGPIMGYNGKIAWGGTMVMGDNQDIYLEKLHVFWGKLHYFYKGQWYPCEERKEVFQIRDRSPEVQTYYSTRHGTLLNSVVQKPSPIPVVPPNVKIGYGLAFQSALAEPGNNPLAFGDLVSAKTIDEAKAVMKQVRGLPFNMVFGDRDNIAWQVTGSYPIRKKGKGLVPSPGWNGDYDWDGYLDPDLHPASLNPAEGFIGTANHRTVAPEFPHTLSSSWFYPERAERINEMLSQNAQHTAEDSMKMQLDQHSLFVGKLQAWLKTEQNKDALAQAIDALGKERRSQASEALSTLLDMNGKLSSDSSEAAVYGAFLHNVTRRIFMDELGPASSENWKAFVRIANISYSAPMDHLLVRGDESPFWDDVKTTEKKETKAEIIAASLADAIAYLEAELGRKRHEWSWGKLHTYHWKADPTINAPKATLKQKIGLEKMEKVLNRGPFAAGGDHSTINTAPYSLGRDFNTWMIPSMRMIVDFSRDEPMLAMNSTGQSAHPTSRHYADSIQRYLDGEYHTFPFKQENIDQTYGKALILQPFK